MTKLLEWLSVFTVLGALWLSIITNKIELNITQQYPTLILISPLIFVALFGIYAFTVVLYRTLTFNTCEKAAEELQKEIKQSRAELTQLGFKFKH